MTPLDESCMLQAPNQERFFIQKRERKNIQQPERVKRDTHVSMGSVLDEMKRMLVYSAARRFGKCTRTSVIWICNFFSLSLFIFPFHIMHRLLFATVKMVSGSHSLANAFSFSRRGYVCDEHRISKQFCSLWFLLWTKINFTSYDLSFSR